MSERPSLGKIGKYQLLKELNKTGNSSVYLALESEFHAPVALKVFGSDFDTPIKSEEFFLNQSRVAQGISNKFLVSILGVNDSPRQSYVVMEYNPGRTLRELIDSGDLTVTQACRIVTKVAIAVSALHEAGTEHLNIHPGNILVHDSGTPCLVGIGSASDFTSREELVQTKKPTSEFVYLAPEHFTDLTENEKKTDLYSLGIILYEALTGQVPYHAENVDKLVAKIVSASPKSPARLVKGVDSKLAAICLKAIQKNPKDRYLSVREFAQNLKTFLKNNSVKPTRPRSKSKKRSQPMFSSQQKAIAGIVCGLAILVVVVFALKQNNFFQNEQPEVVEVPVEAPKIDPFASEVVIEWTQEQFLDSLNENELAARKWIAKLEEFPDTEEAALSLVRFFNASVADPKLVDGSVTAPVYSSSQYGGIGPAPSVTAKLPIRVLELIQENSSPISITALESIALNVESDEISIAKIIPAKIRSSASSLVLKNPQTLSPEMRCQLSFREKIGKPKELLAAVSVKDDPKEELETLKKLMMEFIIYPPTNQNFNVGSYGGTLSSNGYVEDAGQIAIVDRLFAMNEPAADQYLFELLTMKGHGNKRSAMTALVQSKIVETLVTKDHDDSVVTELANIIAELKLAANRVDDGIPSAGDTIQFRPNSFGPMLRKKLVEKFWAQDSIHQDRLLDMIPFHHAASLPALKVLYANPNITSTTRDIIESKIAKNALHTSGIAIGWILESPNLEETDRVALSSQNRMLLGSTGRNKSISSRDSVHMTLIQQPLVIDWLHDEAFLQHVIRRLKGAGTQRMILLDALASTMHPLARKTIRNEVLRFADIGPEEFAGQPVSLATTPEEVARSLRVPDPDKKSNGAHQGWGDPWIILAMKEPKRIRPPQTDPDRPSPGNRPGRRPRPSTDPAEKVKLTPREVQQAWFTAVHKTVEGWHERCRSAISLLPPGAPELRDVLKEFDLELPEGVHLRRQIKWDSNENSRGIISLPEGHRMGFIEFDSREHLKRVKQLFEEIIPSELSLGDDGWTDSTVQQDGIERNIDILYSTDAGMTKGSILIMERPIPENE